MISQQTQKKVYVGLSGGVDSSVSAALLKEQGYDVTGVFIIIWQPEWTECTMKADRLDAMRVCAHLGIPYKEIDLTREYKRHVVSYMIKEYRAGRTPNPDVTCNRFIKFGMFFKWAIGEGADFVATGHYARIRQVKSRKSKFKTEGQNSKLNTKRYMLHVGFDFSKDQSYFLWTLTQKQLARTSFPIGGYKKSEVRMLAKEFNLPNAEKKDSQGLCFLGHVNIKKFLSRYIKEKRGDVLNEEGEVIGTHDGAQFLTIGERHSFSVNTVKARNNRERTRKFAEKNQHPLYVIAKDIKKNTITVASRTNSKSYDISYDSIMLSNTNWILGKAPDEKKKYEAQVRYHGKRYLCRVLNGGRKVEFYSSPGAVALGQSLVVYDGKMCLGGGVIENSV